MRASIKRETLQLLPAGQVADVWVSRHSRWSDPGWYFDNPTAGQRPSKSAIRWDFELPDASRFTDPRWAGLLDCARRLVWSLHVDPRQTKPWKPGSLLPRLVLRVCQPGDHPGTCAVLALSPRPVGDHSYRASAQWAGTVRPCRTRSGQAMQLGLEIDGRRSNRTWSEPCCVRDPTRRRST